MSTRHTTAAAVAAMAVLAVVAGVVGLVLLAGPSPVAAQGAPDTTPPTAAGSDDGNSVIPAPNSGRAPDASGDRGGWAQLTLFALMTLGMAFIAGVVVRSAVRRNRAIGNTVSKTSSGSGPW